MAPEPLSETTIFLITLIFSAIFFIILIFLSMLAKKLAVAISPKGLVSNPCPI